MIKKIITFFMVVITCVVCSTVCSAEVYKSDFPSYCPASGGSWCDVETDKGRACVVVALDNRFGVFGFSGTEGYNILNISNSTVSGYIYFENATDYYTNPIQLQCRFSSFGTLEVYVPYESTYGTRYEWQSLNISAVHSTNIALQDEAGDRQNNELIFTLDQKLLMIVICCLIALLLNYILRRAWNA